MRKIVDFVKMLWQKDKWLFSIFCIGMLSVLTQIIMTFGLVYTTFFAEGTSTLSREYVVSASWAWAPLLVLEFTSMVGIAALSVMIFYIVFMKIRKRPVSWRRTIALGTMSFWTFILWLIFTLFLGFSLRLIFPHLFR